MAGKVIALLVIGIGFAYVWSDGDLSDPRNWVAGAILLITAGAVGLPDFRPHPRERKEQIPMPKLGTNEWMNLEEFKKAVDKAYAQAVDPTKVGVVVQTGDYDDGDEPVSSATFRGDWRITAEIPYLFDPEKLDLFIIKCNEG